MIFSTMFGRAPILLLLLVQFCDGQDENPSIRVRISKKGFDYVNRLATKYLETALMTRQIPNFESTMGANNEAKLQLENVRVVSFEIPEIGYKLAPPRELMWYASGGDMMIEGTFKIEVNKFVRVSGSGTLMANITGVNFTAAAEILSTRMEEPVVNITSCTAEINHMEIRYSGGLIAWLLNKFRETINGRVIQLVTETIIDRVKTVGEQFANGRLGTLPMMMELPANMFLNYRLARAVAVTDDYVEFLHRGEVTVGGARAISYPPIPLPTSNQSDHMILVWVSQYMVNSLFASMHQQQLLELTIDKDRQPQIADSLRTTCMLHEECIGVAIDKVGRIAPNTTAAIKLWSRNPPECVIVKGYSGPKFGGKLHGTLSFLNETDQQELFTFKVSYNVSSTAKVTKGRLFGEVRIVRMSVDVLESQIGRISPMELVFIEVAIQGQLENAINAMMQKGIEIPALSVMKYEFPEVVMDDRSILAYSDMFYAPV